MITLIVAALAAAQAPAPMPQGHEQHRQNTNESHAQHGNMDAMAADCCKHMMKMMHSGQHMDRMHDHQEHSGQPGR
jgi:hypothetical protein